MPKRELAATDPVAEPQPSSKRQRTTSLDRLSQLSDELLLRVLSYASVGDLILCQRASQRLHTIAGDAQLWKTAYYERFVRPRFNKLPKARRSPHSSKIARWLDEGSLVERGKDTNWKRQYKLRHRWSHGICGMSEIPVAPRPPIPPLLARLHDGVVYTVDGSAGLRAWSYRDERQELASYMLSSPSSGPTNAQPTSLAIDSSAQKDKRQRLIVGFEDGQHSVFCYDRNAHQFEQLYSSTPSTNGMLTALAFACPYVLTMSETQTLSLYRTKTNRCDDGPSDVLGPPQLLTAMKSHTVWPPLSLSLRINDDRITAAIAYCMPTFNSGWSAGVQELHISPNDGRIIDSRIASAAGQGFSMANSTSPSPVLSRPTSLSYSHPYLLVSHADNTLTLYLVNSGASTLFVSLGKRLWGHTSSVFGAHVGGRGKAVSVSTRGNEVRVWELEGSTLTKLESDPAGDYSVRVTPERRVKAKASAVRISDALASRNGARCSMDERLSIEPDITRGWVGFDDENVVVLREHEQGRQALAIYDFS